MEIAAIKGVILDLDGLLLDTERVQFEVAPSVVRLFGYELEPVFFEAIVGADRISSIARINAALGTAIEHDVFDHAWNQAMLARMADGIPLRPGVGDFFDALDEARLPRAIATNSLTERAIKKLRGVDLLKRVNDVVGIDAVKAGKPAPDVYREAVRRLGLRPSDCAALDDSDIGIRAAIAAGIRTVIQVPDMVPSIERLAHHQALTLDDARILLGL
ncbi:HAD family hydrolase [Rhizobium sp.]